MPSQQKIEISVVIASYNRASWLQKCLFSLVTQDYNPDNFEIIIVNDGSTDNTEEVLRNFQKNTLLQVKIISHENCGVSASRNRGIEEARGEIIAFTDDDCVVPPQWLSQISKQFSLADNKKTAGIGGPLTSLCTNENSFVGDFVKYLDEFNYIPVLGKIMIKPVHVSKLLGNEVIPYLRTANAAFKKTCLEEIGMFDIAFHCPGGEDPDICYRLLAKGYRFIFDKDLIVEHHTRANFSSYFHSLRNYVTGDFKKNQKKHIYKNPVIQRSYSYLPLQKLASLLLTIIFSPVKWFRAIQQNFSAGRAFCFQIIIVAAKFYCFTISLRLQADYLLKFFKI